VVRSEHTAAREQQQRRPCSRPRTPRAREGNRRDGGGAALGRAGAGAAARGNGGGGVISWQLGSGWRRVRSAVRFFFQSPTPVPLSATPKRAMVWAHMLHAQESTVRRILRCEYLRK
jgi:hypothetical protein